MHSCFETPRHSAWKTRVNALKARLLSMRERVERSRLPYEVLRCARDTRVHAAAADVPIAAFTRGMTSSAINCIERLLSAGSTQSIPA